MKLEYDYECDKGNGTSTLPAFTVEARSEAMPVEIAEQIFDGKWRNVSFQESLVGVPNGSSRQLSEHGMLSYAAAQALRWWLHATSQADYSSSGFCLDTRIVKHIIESTYKITAVSVHDEIGGEDRTNFMPPKEESDD